MPARSDHSADRLLGQLEWTADELEAQRPFIERLPERQLTAAPVEGEPSIRQHYEDLLRRERERHLPVVMEFAGRSQAPAPSGAPLDAFETVDEIMAAVIESRRRLVDILKTIPAADRQKAIPGTDDSLETFLYAAALNDGEVLRRIGERLYESELRLSDSDGVTD